MDNGVASTSTSTSTSNQSSLSSATGSSLLLGSPLLTVAVTPRPPRPDSPVSPSASAFLRTGATLDGLARQLDELSSEASASESEGGAAAARELKCCCGDGAGRRCRMWRDRNRMEDKLKISGEIGQALLYRYEVLEAKFRKEVERYDRELQVKRKALEDAVRRVRILENANTKHLQQYAEMSKKGEAMEKRYTQAMHTQTLTQQSLTHVRAELSSLRSTSTRQSLALASGSDLEERLMDAEKRYEETRDHLEAQERKTKDEARRRKRAEERIQELEEEVKKGLTEIEEVKEGRKRDAEELLNNAKERLTLLHSELSETFRADAPHEAPEYQRALEDLVASNALLKHDASELSAMLGDSREEIRILQKELDDLRANHSVQLPHRFSPGGPLPLVLATELMQSSGQSHSHSRTESSPMAGTYAERLGWSRMSVSTNRTAAINAWEHHRKSSMAPSVTSSSTMDGITSPGGLGMGQIGEYSGALTISEGALSPPPTGGSDSPTTATGFRTSPSGGVGYMLNGVPVNPAVRPQTRRTFSMDRRRSYFPPGVESIAEAISNEEIRHRPQSPLSPGSEYFAHAEASRKRRSVLLSRVNTHSPRGSGDESYQAGGTTLVDQSTHVDLPSPLSESAITSDNPHGEKRTQRKTLLLLSRSRGVQTDPPEQSEWQGTGTTQPKAETLAGERAAPVPHSIDHSETSSLHETRNEAGSLTLIIDHLSKLLSRLRSADVPSLNRRLRKHNLPGDVGHLSRTTLRALNAEVSELRHTFRGALDQSTVSRREMTLLLKLLKDVFTELIEFQAIVNDVTVDPSLAKKLNRAAYREEEEDAAKARQATGLGWIAAPITKFFVTPAVDPADKSPDPRSGRISDRGRLNPGVTGDKALKAVPKQQAVTSATTTHISVEFGGAGMVRKATPAIAPPSTSTKLVEGLPPSPTGLPGLPTEGHTPGESAAAPSSSATATGAAATLKVPGTLRPSKSRANRNELLGIFAGAQRPISPTPGSWQVVSGASAPDGQPRLQVNRGKGLRSTSSGYFHEDAKTIRARVPEPSKKLPAMVDAVIDTSAQQLVDSDPATTHPGEYEPQAPLLERQLRPRGLSDSSIRSTFVSHGLGTTEPEDTFAAPTRQPAYPAGQGSGPKRPTRGIGLLESLSSRFYSFRSGTSEVSPVNPDGPKTQETEADVEAPSPERLEDAGNQDKDKGNGSGTPIITQQQQQQQQQASPARPISMANSLSTTTDSHLTVSPQTVSSSQTGLFSILASSLVGAQSESAQDTRARRMSGVDNGMDDPGMTLSVGKGVVSRSLSSGRPGGSWR